jgi:hypothetical protein
MEVIQITSDISLCRQTDNSDPGVAFRRAIAARLLGKLGRKQHLQVCTMHPRTLYHKLKNATKGRSGSTPLGLHESASLQQSWERASSSHPSTQFDEYEDVSLIDPYQTPVSYHTRESQPYRFTTVRGSPLTPSSSCSFHEQANAPLVGQYHPQPALPENDHSPTIVIVIRHSPSIASSSDREPGYFPQSRQSFSWLKRDEIVARIREWAVDTSLQSSGYTHPFPSRQPPNLPSSPATSVNANNANSLDGTWPDTEKNQQDHRNVPSTKQARTEEWVAYQQHVDQRRARPGCELYR